MYGVAQKNKSILQYQIMDAKRNYALVVLNFEEKFADLWVLGKEKYDKKRSVCDVRRSGGIRTAQSEHKQFCGKAS